MQQQDPLEDSESLITGILSIRPLRLCLNPQKSQPRSINAFIVIQHNNQQVKTSVCKYSENNAHWSEQIELKVSNVDYLHFQVYNKHANKSDELLGAGKIQINKMAMPDEDFLHKILLNSLDSSAGCLTILSTFSHQKVSKKIVKDLSSVVLSSYERHSAISKLPEGVKTLVVNKSSSTKSRQRSNGLDSSTEMSSTESLTQQHSKKDITMYKKSKNCNESHQSHESSYSNLTDCDYSLGLPFSINSMYIFNESY